MARPTASLRAWTSHRATLEQTPEARNSRYHIYGSPLRDSAAVLVFLAEAGIADTSLVDMGILLNEGFVTTPYASTQERAWVVAIDRR